MEEEYFIERLTHQPSSITVVLGQPNVGKSVSMSAHLLDVVGQKKKKKNLHMCGVIEGRASRLPRHGPCSQLPPLVT
jgi:hypothetical protein